jgi:hypothetical protein
VQKERLCWFWFNSAYLNNSLSFVVQRSEIDKAVKDKSFHDDFNITMKFSCTTDGLAPEIAASLETGSAAAVASTTTTTTSSSPFPDGGDHAVAIIATNGTTHADELVAVSYEPPSEHVREPSSEPPKSSEPASEEDTDSESDKSGDTKQNADQKPPVASAETASGTASQSEEASGSESETASESASDSEESGDESG